MSTESYSNTIEWKITCTTLMTLALATVICGTLPLTVYSNASNEFGMGHLLYLIAWLYGLLGIGAFHLENAACKTPIMVTALVWSITSALWSTIINTTGQAPGIRTNYPFNPDGNILFIMLCIVYGVSLSHYSRIQRQTSSKITFSIKLINRLFIVFWTVTVLPLLKLLW